MNMTTEKTDEPAGHKVGCNCIAEINAMLVEHNTTLVTTMFRDPDTCVVSTDRIKTLRNGKKAALVIASFCPFCGVKYQPKAAIAQAQPVTHD